MMKATIVSLARGFSILSVFVVCAVFSPVPVQAQYEVVPASAASYSREELAQLLAPVALYPDALLAQILMASTYPIEVVEADRWLRQNSHLQGDALDIALVELNWDPSVKALCHFPSILALMSERIAETSDLGNAFLAQEAEVMAMVQELRAAAYAQGNLRTNGQQNVIVERETIIIEPVNPRVVYVPYYDPFYVYGSWWYPDYPPYYWGPSGVSVVGISYWPGIYFSFSYSNWSYFDWHRRVIYVDSHKRPKYVHHDRWVSKPGPWKHNSAHRRGFAYRDAGTAKKYGQPYHRSVEDRRERRGAPEPGNLKSAKGRRLEDRPWLKQDQRRDERSRVERSRPGSAQTGRKEPQVRERSGRELQQPVRVDRSRPDGERVQRREVDRERQQPGRLDRNRQERERLQLPGVDRDRQRQQMSDRERQMRQHLEQGRALRERAERLQPERSRGGRQWQQDGQEQRVRERVQGVQQPARRDSNLNQGQSGRDGYKSRPSGQVDRQGAAKDARGGGRSGGESRSGRDSRGGNGR